ncbi:MarR family winged helix-turn-helix transcriptional regulator [Brevibacterium samyangense]|uniref:HTH marR-type domain-containing protein n=1 Tax=Brevibacterium samyangense TaxID=366888 RepID=A0ABN2T7P7_9MICO
MLPDPLIELFESRLPDLTGESGTPNVERSEQTSLFVHAAQVEAMVMRTAMARYARAHDLNLIDFQVVQSVVSLGEVGRTATPGYISTLLSMSASTLTSILERLVNRGYLTRERDSADRRRISVYYTESSADLIREFYTMLEDAYTPMFTHLSTEDIAARTDFVRLMTEATQTMIEKLSDGPAPTFEG